MNKTALLKILERETVMIWDSLCEIYPTLVFINPPKIKLNPYFWRTAGQCHQHDGIIEMGSKFFKKSENFSIMIDVILPHEIIHYADFVLYGESEKICGHGEKWAEIMVNYGLPANPYHSMEISKNA
jgi:predicted SprT family Zn-dependent metalloprotease